MASWNAARISDAHEEDQEADADPQLFGCSEFQKWSSKKRACGPIPDAGGGGLERLAERARPSASQGWLRPSPVAIALTLAMALSRDGADALFGVGPA